MSAEESSEGHLGSSCTETLGLPGASEGKTRAGLLRRNRLGRRFADPIAVGLKISVCGHHGANHDGCEAPRFGRIRLRLYRRLRDRDSSLVKEAVPPAACFDPQRRSTYLGPRFRSAGVPEAWVLGVASTHRYGIRLFLDSSSHRSSYGRPSDLTWRNLINGRALERYSSGPLSLFRKASVVRYELPLRCRSSSKMPEVPICWMWTETITSISAWRGDP